MAESPDDPPFRSTKSTEAIQAAYDEEEATSYVERHWLKRRIERRTRRHQFGDATGRVLDVACGTGENLPHLPESTEIVGIDISTPMLLLARERADDLGRQVELEQMDAQRLSFADDSFDHVISSLSTCTFPDPTEALNEMGRVCKPDGQIRLLEHHKWKAPVFGRVTERMHEGEYERVGCRLYEDPTTVVRQSNLEVISDRRWRLPPFTGITACPPTTADTPI
ncbi:class I SAM-dependent methyltransferase [Halobacteriaceae archaeon SHR40]|uniref:class I SAM-dependent methyltransferase n=1 Tax=Halovenus amylolytica TaxID=2500550 RepID=UPI000FE3EC12